VIGHVHVIIRAVPTLISTTISAPNQVVFGKYHKAIVEIEITPFL